MIRHSVLRVKREPENYFATPFSGKPKAQALASNETALPDSRKGRISVEKKSIRVLSWRAGRARWRIQATRRRFIRRRRLLVAARRGRFIRQRKASLVIHHADCREGREQNDQCTGREQFRKHENLLIEKKRANTSYIFARRRPHVNRENGNSARRVSFSPLARIILKNRSFLGWKDDSAPARGR
jgi:hypothetical protein